MKFDSIEMVLGEPDGDTCTWLTTELSKEEISEEYNKIGQRPEEQGHDHKYIDNYIAGKVIFFISEKLNRVTKICIAPLYDRQDPDMVVRQQWGKFVEADKSWWDYCDDAMDFYRNEATYKGNCLESIRNSIVTSSYDFSERKGPAWVYGIVFGWDEAEESIQRKMGFSDVDMRTMKKLHEQWKKLEKYIEDNEEALNE